VATSSVTPLLFVFVCAIASSLHVRAAADC